MDQTNIIGFLPIPFNLFHKNRQSNNVNNN